jgi:uncharacterized protein with von Willebrand factor type A (vWA) domain
MDQVFQDFISALRLSGVRVSVAESIDAAHSLDLIGYGDRETLKDALGAALAKSFNEKVIFGSIFDRFFAGEEILQGRKEPADSSPAGTGEGVISPLAGLLLSGDSDALSLLMREAARAVDLTSIRFSTQRGIYIRRVLDRMGWDSLIEDIRRTEQEPGAGGVQTARLEEAKDLLYEKVKTYVERQLALFANSSMEKVIESNLRNISLSRMEERDFERMEGLIRKMVKRLNTLHSRRWKAFKRGQIDLKKTLGKSIAFQGLPFDMGWKARKVERAEIVVLCDVSRSVRTIVRFLLLFLYSLNQTLARIRTFVFCSNLVEVSDLFENYSVEEALTRIQTGTGLGISLGRTDYAQALSDFRDGWLDIVTNKTTVIILGDGRNNYGDPGTEILQAISRRCKRLIWLNPESRPQWGTGDSEMKRYLPYCHMVKQCRSVKHLERIVDTLLEQLR